MEIIDINGRRRNIISYRVVTEQVPDAINGGVAATKQFVEVVIQGKTGRTWKEWYPLEDFKRLNPKVKLDA